MRGGPRGLCTLEGCGLPHRARGYCSIHYARWLRHGDPLISHRAANGTRKPPEGLCEPKRTRARTRLTPAQVIAIRRETGRTHQEIAHEYGIARQTVDAIRAGLTWRWLA